MFSYTYRRCEGWNANASAYICGGVGNELRWNVPLGDTDYTFTTTLLLEVVDNTAAALSLSSFPIGDSHPEDKYAGADYAGLDGGNLQPGSLMFYAGTHWGRDATTTRTPAPPANTWFNFTLKRVSGVTSAVLLDDRNPSDQQVFSTPISFNITGVGLRPHRSTMAIRAFEVCQEHLPPPSPPTPPPPPLPPTGCGKCHGPSAFGCTCNCCVYVFFMLSLS